MCFHTWHSAPLPLLLSICLLWYWKVAMQRDFLPSCWQQTKSVVVRFCVCERMCKCLTHSGKDTFFSISHVSKDDKSSPGTEREKEAGRQILLLLFPQRIFLQKWKEEEEERWDMKEKKIQKLDLPVPLPWLYSYLQVRRETRADRDESMHVFLSRQSFTNLLTCDKIRIPLSLSSQGLERVFSTLFFPSECMTHSSSKRERYSTIFTIIYLHLFHLVWLSREIWSHLVIFTFSLTHQNGSHISPPLSRFLHLFLPSPMTPVRCKLSEREFAASRSVMSITHYIRSYITNIDMSFFSPFSNQTPIKFNVQESRHRVRQRDDPSFHWSDKNPSWG